MKTMLKDPDMLRLWVGAVTGVLGVICAVMIGLRGDELLRNERQLKAQISVTAAGRFAMTSLHECSKGGALFEERTELECAEVTINVARQLKGEQFSREVAVSVSRWIERPTKNQAIRTIPLGSD